LGGLRTSILWCPFDRSSRAGIDEGVFAREMGRADWLPFSRPERPQIGALRDTRSVKASAPMRVAKARMMCADVSALDRIRSDEHRRSSIAFIRVIVASRCSWATSSYSIFRRSYLETALSTSPAAKVNSLYCGLQLNTVGFGLPSALRGRPFLMSHAAVVAGLSQVRQR
jgi:hypothetical protein